MRNIKLTLAYDGTGFSGYELQREKRTVRSEIEKAFFKLFKSHPKIINSSRTDSGVHAASQTISFTINNPIPISRIPAALNNCLPEDIRAIKAEEKRLHARFDAKNKEYEYLIFNGLILPPIYRNFVWQVRAKLDMPAMKKAARVLVGRHDFSSFCAAGSDGRNFTRVIFRLSVSKKRIRIWDGTVLPVISFKVKGDGFLHKMVRNMVGTLVEVGLGKTNLLEVRKILGGKDRRLAGRTAPARGLCLVKVNY